VRSDGCGSYSRNASQHRFCQRVLQTRASPDAPVRNQPILPKSSEFSSRVAAPTISLSHEQSRTTSGTNGLPRKRRQLPPGCGHWIWMMVFFGLRWPFPFFPGSRIRKTKAEIPAVHCPLHCRHRRSVPNRLPETAAPVRPKDPRRRL
jgi:hypothetical protein